MSQYSTEHYQHCKTLLNKYEQHFRIRWIILACLTAGVVYARAISIPGMILALLVSIAALVAAFFLSLERPWLYAVLLGILLVGSLTGVLSAFGYLELAVYLTAIPEYRKFRWIREQPGYPHFSERLDEQMAHREYEPDHKLNAPASDTMQSAEMPEIR